MEEPCEGDIIDGQCVGKEFPLPTIPIPTDGTETGTGTPPPVDELPNTGLGVEGIILAAVLILAGLALRIRAVTR